MNKETLQQTPKKIYNIKWKYFKLEKSKRN